MRCTRAVLTAITAALILTPFAGGLCFGSVIPPQGGLPDCRAHPPAFTSDLILCDYSESGGTERRSTLGLRPSALRERGSERCDIARVIVAPIVYDDVSPSLDDAPSRTRGTLLLFFRPVAGHFGDQSSRVIFILLLPRSHTIVA